MDFKEEIVNILRIIIEIDSNLIEIPPNSQLGDFSVPCHKFAKELKKSPNQISADLAKKIKINKFFSKIVNNGPYLNFFVNKSILIENNLLNIYNQGKNYGSTDIGAGKNIVVDYSSPNIAKPFGIAHIRSTVIGNSICKIYSALGYNVIRINHLGDWGTQFGKLMVAYLKWGDEKQLEKDGINYLVEIYIEFGKKAKENPLLNDEAREWFKNLESGNPKAVELWRKFRELSLEEFNKYYEMLEIEFDYFHGEAFYNEQLNDIIGIIKSKIKTEISEGALIIDLNDKGIDTPLLLKKSDGATTYHTRDLAAAFYRLKHFTPEKIIYVVGIPQKLHFNQLFTVLEMLGEDRNRFVYVDFGTMTFEGEMMSTRKGNFIPLSDVIGKAIKIAKEIIEEKNPSLQDKEKVAEQIGIGSVIFGDLLNERTHDIDFSWEKAVNLKGETAPYIQYTHARICSIERKADIDIKKIVNFNLLATSIEFELTKLLGVFPDKIIQAANTYKPHIIATYLINIAQIFNKFYDQCIIIKEKPDLRDARLLLAESTRIVLENGLKLLGIHAPKEM